MSAPNFVHRLQLTYVPQEESKSHDVAKPAAFFGEQGLEHTKYLLGLTDNIVGSNDSSFGISGSQPCREKQIMITGNANSERKGRRRAYSICASSEGAPS